MIARLPRIAPSQRKLILSVVANFATRLPGIAGVLFFIPRLKEAVTVDRFSLLFAAMALGGSLSFPMSGTATLGRRYVGEAFGDQDHAAEASAIRDLFLSSGVLWLGSAALAAVYALWTGNGPFFIFGALLTLLVGFVGLADNVRAAYNEHYITATSQVACQVVIYAVAFLIPRQNYGLMLALAVMQGPYLLASLYTGASLVRSRPYLLHGVPRRWLQLLRHGCVLGFGEGLLTSSLGFVVVMLNATAPAPVSAWYATTLRLFSTILVPAMLVLLPISSYVRIRWNDWTVARRRRVMTLTLVGSLGYSLMVGVGIALVSRLYVGGVLHLPAPGTTAQLAAVFGLFATVVLVKTYASIALVVLDAVRLSFSIAVTTLVALAVGGAALLVLSPLGAVTLFACCMIVGAPTVIALSIVAFRRAVQPPEAGRESEAMATVPL